MRNLDSTDRSIIKMSYWIEIDWLFMIICIFVLYIVLKAYLSCLLHLCVLNPLVKDIKFTRLLPQLKHSQNVQKYLLFKLCKSYKTDPLFPSGSKCVLKWYKMHLLLYIMFHLHRLNVKCSFAKSEKKKKGKGKQPFFCTISNQIFVTDIGQVQKCTSGG